MTTYCHYITYDSSYTHDLSSGTPEVGDKITNALAYKAFETYQEAREEADKKGITVLKCISTILYNYTE